MVDILLKWSELMTKLKKSSQRSNKAGRSSNCPQAKHY